jgi:hypothetical protein
VLGPEEVHGRGVPRSEEAMPTGHPPSAKEELIMVNNNYGQRYRTDRRTQLTQNILLFLGLSTTRIHNQIVSTALVTLVAGRILACVSVWTPSERNRPVSKKHSFFSKNRKFIPG